MNDDIVSKTPGGEQMLKGGIVFLAALLFYQSFKYSVGDIVLYILMALMAFGAVVFVRGLIAWKYTDPLVHQLNNEPQNLFIDIPLHGGKTNRLHKIEDLMIELSRRNKDLFSVEAQTIDAPNDVGTLHLSTKNADRLYLLIHPILSKMAGGKLVKIFPEKGNAIDVEIMGKRIIFDPVK